MKTNILDAQAPSDLDALTSAVHWMNHKNEEVAALANRSILAKELYLARPYRVGHQYPKKRNYTGEHWFSNTGTHVWFESLFERQALLWLDFTSDVVAVATQPMRMDFANGMHHIPDIIALHSDYRQIVYDVKPASLINAKVRAQFNETANVCDQVGWGYEIISSFGHIAQGNLAWLSNFRQHHYAPPAEARTQLLEALETPRPLGKASESMRSERPHAAVGWLYHLAWIGDVKLDLSVPFSNSTLVRKATPCAL